MHVETGKYMGIEVGRATGVLLVQSQSQIQYSRLDGSGAQEQEMAYIKVG
jgi:hypothetical protein